jgi:hypothetical protein
MLFTQHWQAASISRNREVVIHHLLVSAESDANLLAWMIAMAEKNAAATGTDVKNYCREVRKIEVTRGWVDSFLSPHSAGLIEKKS